MLQLDQGDQSENALFSNYQLKLRGPPINLNHLMEY